MAKLLLYGEIGWEVNSKDVVSWLDQHKDEHVEMHVNSPGGDVFEAIAIRSAVMSHGDIEIMVDSLAASAAAIISLCGKPLTMSEYSRLMIHSASSFASGNAKALEEQLEMLRAIDRDLASMIADKMGREAEEIEEEYFDGKDHWLTADECVEMGIAVKAEPKTSDRLRPQAWDCLNGYSNNIHQNITDMDKTKFQDIAVLRDCETEEQVAEAVNAQAEELEKANALIEEKDAKIAELENQVAQFEAEKKAAQDAEDEATIDSAVKDGRISETQADIFRDLMKSDRENALKAIAAIPSPQKPADVRDYMKGEGEIAKKSYFAEEMEKIANRK